MASATTTPRSTTISGAREDGGFLDAPGGGPKDEGGGIGSLMIPHSSRTAAYGANAPPPELFPGRGRRGGHVLLKTRDAQLLHATLQRGGFETQQRRGAPRAVDPA